jgi:hypothetical protein
MGRWGWGIGPASPVSLVGDEAFEVTEMSAAIEIPGAAELPGVTE